jgi:Protein of unknown function DUF262
MKRPDKMTPRELFQLPARYVAPVFQRFYAWGGDELEDFFEDLENARTAGPDRSPQFLGAIVLQERERESPAAPQVYLMIDGQQRLTTLYLVVTGLAALAGELGHSTEAEGLVRQYLATSGGPHYEGRPKVLPTAQDRESFYSLLKFSLPLYQWNCNDDPPVGDGRRGLQNQWERIQKELTQRLVNEKGRLGVDEWKHVANAVLDRMELVCIHIEQQEDPNLIFSRLNARGQPLGLADLVRNAAFSKFDHEKARHSQRFYDDKWLPFELRFPNDSLERYFQPFSIIKTEGRATKATAFSDLEEKWKKKSAEAILADLEVYAPYYIALQEYEPIPGLHDRVNAVLSDLALMPKLTVSWPFIIQVLHGCRTGVLHWRKAEESLRVVERMLVRRALVGWEPTGLHKVFKRMWQETDGEPKRVLENIQTTTIKAPHDDHLRHELQQSAVDTRKMTHYILWQYERAVRDEEGSDSIPELDATLEHILPQER